MAGQAQVGEAYRVDGDRFLVSSYRFFRCCFSWNVVQEPSGKPTSRSSDSQTGHFGVNRAVKDGVRLCRKRLGGRLVETRAFRRRV